MESALKKFYWGFLFVMLSFRIQGFDILPDVVGYVLFAAGFHQLASSSTHFQTAEKFNMPLIILSLFSFYQPPASVQTQFSGTSFMLGIVVSAATIGFNLYVIYQLFMGIRELIFDKEQGTLVSGAEECWNRYKNLQIAAIIGIAIAIIPGINILYIIVLFVAAIVILISILKYLNKCITACQYTDWKHE